MKDITISESTVITTERTIN